MCFLTQVRSKTSFGTAVSSPSPSPPKSAKRERRPSTLKNEKDLSQGIARAKFAVARKAQQTESLHSKGRPAWGVTSSYAGTKAADARRKALLYDARNLSPIYTVWRLDKIWQTAVLQLFCHPGTWLVFAMYIVTAVLVRKGRVEFSDIDRDTFEGGTTLVIFMIVFYVGCACAHAKLAAST